MLDDSLLIPGIILSLGGAALLRAVLWLYYRDGERILPLLRLAAPPLVVKGVTGSE